MGLGSVKKCTLLTARFSFVSSPRQLHTAWSRMWTCVIILQIQWSHYRVCQNTGRKEHIRQLTKSRCMQRRGATKDAFWTLISAKKIGLLCCSDCPNWGAKNCNTVIPEESRCVYKKFTKRTEAWWRGSSFGIAGGFVQGFKQFSKFLNHSILW